MSEQYKGFIVEYRTSMFSVEAIVKNNRKGRVWSLQAQANDKDAAQQIIRKRIDTYLEEQS